MSGNLLEGCNGPESVSLGAAMALLSWQGKDTTQLPGAIRLSDSMVLVLSATKHDRYYVVTTSKCNCPAAIYHPEKRCKHIRKYFSEPQMSKSQLQQIPDEVHEDPVLAGYDGPSC